MRRLATWIVGTLVIGIAGPTGWAEDERAPKTASEAGEKADGGSKRTSPLDGGVVVAAQVPVFVPPNRGAPLTRLGGATRSTANGDIPRIEAMVPEEPGWTLEEQPVLYWNLAETTDLTIEFVLLRLDPPEPLALATLPRPEQAGLQRVQLADHGVRLEPEVTYQWLVKIVARPDDRSYDRIVGGGIVRKPASAELTRKLSERGASRPHVLAQEGMWYDAVDALSRQIDLDPENEALRAQRTALFKQVGLPEEMD